MVLNIKRIALSTDTEDFDVLETPVKPFKHQVGGHTAFCSLPNGHLLKPCDERELLFYRNIPAGLLPIVPRCCSTIQGTSTLSLPNTCDDCHFYEDDIVIPKLTNSPTSMKKRKMSRNFLVLSDLTSGFELPCVLDLKLGTRQHSDHAPQEKIKTQIEKCRRTTSAEFGLRLCGMQFFESDGHAITMDKYEGRLLTAESLRDVINYFFDHAPVGSHAPLRSHAPLGSHAPFEGPFHSTREIVRERVLHIIETLSTLNGLRLFGASLLIVIEGSPTAIPKVEVRLVDFANATFPHFLNDKCYEGIDVGCIKGLKNLRKILER